MHQLAPMSVEPNEVRKMPNAVLERLRDARTEQIATMDAILSQVGEDRDLVDAERGLLEAARGRIAELDEQIAPLAAYEDMREAHNDRRAKLLRPHAVPRQVDGPTRDFPYGSPGAFVVDYLRARGIMDRNVRDENAAARVARAYEARADQTTADTPGLLPTPPLSAAS